MQDQQNQQNWTLGLSKTEPSTKGHKMAKLTIPFIYITDIQLGVHEGPTQEEQELSHKLLLVCGICSNWVRLFWPQWKKKCLS